MIFQFLCDTPMWQETDSQRAFYQFPDGSQMFNFSEDVQLDISLKHKILHLFPPLTGILDQEAGIFSKFILKRAIFDCEGMTGFNDQVELVGHQLMKIDG